MPDCDQLARRRAVLKGDGSVVARPPSSTASGDNVARNGHSHLTTPLDRSSMPRRVLIVEDDAGIRNLLTCILEMDGYDVVTAVDGIDGWKRMNEAPAAVVITDFLLPRLDGLDFARRLRAAFGTTTKIVVVSSLRAANRRVVAENVADVFLPKPVDVRHLRRVIATLWD